MSLSEGKDCTLGETVKTEFVHLEKQSRLGETVKTEIVHLEKQ